jgi:transcriptional regulator with XRE-family HTH domain
MTLDHLAELAGISKGHLSRFERDQKSLSLAKLMRLANALGSSVAALLGESADTDRFHISRSRERSFRTATGSDGGYSFATLSRPDDKVVSSFLLQFERGSEGRPSARAHHEGEELFFVLSGVVEVELNDQISVLRKGDYLQFSGTVRHHIRSLAARSEVLLFVIRD